MVFWVAEVLRNTRTHTRGKSYHHTPLWHRGLSRALHGSEGGGNIENELNLHRDGGSLPFPAIFCPFLSGVSNWASEMGEIATSWNKVTKQLYFLGYIWTGKWPTGNRWEGQKVGLCLSMFAQNTKQVYVCLCAAWLWLSGSNFPCRI